MSSVPKPASSERKLRAILIGILLALSSAFFIAYVYFFSTTGFTRNDFFVFWAAARFLQNGALQAAYDPTTFYAFDRSLDAHSQGGMPFVYPPHTAMLFMPFGHLSIHTALIAWEIVSLAIYLAGCWQIFKPHKLAMFAALIAPSAVSNLMYGQTGLVTGGLTILAFSLLKRSSVLSGVAFGMLSIKPQMAALPLLVLLLSGNSRARTAALMTMVLLVLASLVVFQPSDWSDWLEALSWFSSAFSASPWHYQNGVTVYFTALNLGAGRHLAIALQGIVAALVLWQVVRLIRRDSSPLAIMAALIGVCLATPYAMFYDLPIVSAVCVMIVLEGNRTGFRDGELLIAAAAWFLPLLLIASGGGNPALALCVLLGLFALILRRIKEGTPKGNNETGPDATAALS